jgi:hypothetical protein
MRQQRLIFLPEAGAEKICQIISIPSVEKRESERERKGAASTLPRSLSRPDEERLQGVLRLNQLPLLSSSSSSNYGFHFSFAKEGTFFALLLPLA